MANLAPEIAAWAAQVPESLLTGASGALVASLRDMDQLEEDEGKEGGDEGKEDGEGKEAAEEHRPLASRVERWQQAC